MIRGFEKDVPKRSEGKNNPFGLFLGRGLSNPTKCTKRIDLNPDREKILDK